jgi:hypothetical protein
VPLRTKHHCLVLRVNYLIQVMLRTSRCSRNVDKTAKIC